jgi:hypothetical protein
VKQLEGAQEPQQLVARNTIQILKVPRMGAGMKGTRMKIAERLGPVQSEILSEEMRVSKSNPVMATPATPALAAGVAASGVLVGAFIGGFQVGQAIGG